MAKQFVCNDSTVVTTTKGKLRGFLFDGIYTFHGIRYAKAKRFQMPEPVDAWDGVKDALSYGMICPVLNQPMPMGEVMTPHRFWPESEHCQYLNVWTKSIDPSAKKPVMVWFHGGGYSAGSSIEQVAYEGDNLAKFGDVVVVTVNHRLNVFGHLDLSAFGEKYWNSVNVGIADLVASLEWVRDNIAAFGGDPDNVLIFGQSGGGGKVTTLGQTPAADGLFHKAIVMSGVIGEDFQTSTVSGKEFALAIAAELGIEEKDIEKLEKVPSKLLIRATNKAEKKLRKEGKFYNWGPVANSWYKGDPLKVGFNPSYQKVPTMVGSVLAEFAFGGPVLMDKEGMSAEERRAVVAAKFGEENADKVIACFKSAYPDKNEVYACDLDVNGFRPLTIKYVKEKAKDAEAPVYSYMFSLIFNYMGGKAAWHCSDIAFFFHNATRLPICQIDGVTEQLEDKMAGAFVNFAYTGNPNVEGLPEWHPSTGDTVNTMVFDAECEERVNYDEDVVKYIASVTPPFHFDFNMDDDEDEEGGSAWFF